MISSDFAVDPHWYRDAVIYELHVRAFKDSDDDGIGDFRGLTEKLDYLQDLGVTALWLLPFYPSPLKDDGYDIADYSRIHPSYGNLREFKTFLREAHRRGLRVITELVINHTSVDHPWFQRARNAEAGSIWRDFYVWSDTPDKYSEARIIFKDYEHSNWAWDPVAKAYYWHRFYSHQPDLNYDNPAVRKAVFQIMDFWLDMGIDGLRLDAVPYLYEREGTNCENLAETHKFFKEIRHHMDERYRDRMLLAEANQWPEDAVAYFGDGDESHMAFHFPIMPRMFMAIRMEDRYPIIDTLSQTPKIPPTCQWALFLRNHDELTLEMVTDEERDYMYRVYAQDPEARINLGIRRRLAPLLGNHRRRIELMNGLLFSLPGTPILYYGDEIGMGDNIYLGDRNGVRTPMQWSADRNAGFSRANPQRLYLPLIVDSEYHHESPNVEAQQKNPHSLLWWTKRLIALRKRFKSFGRGSIEVLYPENRKVLAFIRRYEDEIILVVANLSRFAQYVELNLGEFAGMAPVEMFGGTRFPTIGELPYLLTLGPHTFYWFTIEGRHTADVPSGRPADHAEMADDSLPVLDANGDWTCLLVGQEKSRLEAVLSNYLPARRWFRGKARRMRSARIQEAIPVTGNASTTYLVMIKVEYTEGDPETYTVPLAFATGERVAYPQDQIPHAVVARVHQKGKEKGTIGILYDAMADSSFPEVLLDAIDHRRNFRSVAGALVASSTGAFRHLRGSSKEALVPQVSQTEQSNTSVTYGDRLILKLFRRLGDGPNPELEVGRFLTERVAFTHTPSMAGALEYRRGRNEPVTVAILQEFVPNQGDAWQFTLDALGHYFEQAGTRLNGVDLGLLPDPASLTLSETDPPPLAEETLGTYLEVARLLGQRTADLHVALGAPVGDSNFAPEPFSALYQRSLYQSMRSQMNEVFHLLANRLPHFGDELANDGQRLLDREADVLAIFQAVRSHRINAMRIRCHGDYHLGQVLFTGRDFVIIDFEGEPARTLGERKIKRSPLRDVAGMIRSFHNAAYSALFQAIERGIARPEDIPRLDPWARFWHAWASATFLKAYLDVASQTTLLPPNRDDLEILTRAFVLEKAIYELGYELNNRPTWVKIPLQGILQQLEATHR